MIKQGEHFWLACDERRCRATTPNWASPAQAAEAAIELGWTVELSDFAQASPLQASAIDVLHSLCPNHAPGEA